MLILIVAFLALCSADIFYSYAVHFTALEVFVELFVNAVKFITGAVALIIKINF